MESKIQFADEKIKKAFDKLDESDKELHKFMSRAFVDIQNNCFCGI